MNLSGIPYAELRIDARGDADRADVRDLATTVGTAGVADAVVLAHGWNNTAEQARAFYRGLAERLAAAGPLPGTVLVGVVWPSSRLAEVAATAGGAATTGGPSDAVLDARLTRFAAALDHPGATAELVAASAAVPALDSAASAQRRFVDAVRAALRTATAAADGPAGDEETPAALFTLDGAELLERLSRPARLRGPGDGAGGGATSIGARGGAAGVDILGGIRNAARNLIDVSTYYVMKERAGVVGARGLAPVRAELSATRPGLRWHLVGHSFGARLVTAAAAEPVDAGLSPVASMALLQGAFSHFGFARDWKPGHDGAFRACLTERHVDGPVLVTHTANDRAVGIAYALASRVAGQVAAAVGGPDDVFGGIGRNGALQTPEARAARLLDVGGVYDLQPGLVHNLLADAFVTNHSDVTGPQVAHALRAALRVGAAVG